MKLRKKVDKILANTLLLILIMMIVNIVWHLITRFLLKNPSSFNDELARYLMIWTVVLGIAYISGKKLNLSIDFLPKILNTEKQQILKKSFNIFLIFACFVGLVVYGIWLVYETYSLNEISPTLQIPLALVYAVIPISGLLIIYYKTSDVLNSKKLINTKI